MEKRAHFPQLDGLRGLAAMIVLMHHYWPASVCIDPTGGRLGVDFFFVLSGFLITRSLLRARTEHPQERWALWASFHGRRMRRIFPVFYMTLALVFLGLPSERTIAMLWHACFLTNWYFIFQGHYLGAGAHLWALAVEQQYYLLWPPIILFVPRRQLRAAALFMILLGIIFRGLAGLYAWPSIIFDVATPSAFEAMGCGAVLSLWMTLRENTPARSALWISLLGLSGLLLLLLRIIFQGTRPGDLLSLLTTELDRSLLITWVIAQAVWGIPGPIGRVLESAPARALGAWSYAIYICHNFFLTGVLRPSAWSV